MSENKPMTKFRSGGVVATVWENTIEKNGNNLTVYNVQLERTYKNDKDEWKTTNSYKVGDLPKVELVVREAFKLLALKDQESSE